MAPLPVIFNDIPREIHRVLSTIKLHINRKAQVTCHFSCLSENEGLLKVAASHVCCKCGNISEMVPDSPCYYRPLWQR